MSVNPKSLYYKYGAVITDGFSEFLYERILADPQLLNFFERIDTEALQEHMSALLCEISGGPDMYKGRDLKSAHEPFSITAHEFSRVVRHMKESLEELGVEEEDATAILSVIGDKADQVINA